MGANFSYALTSSSVPPGRTIDLSIPLKAPNTPGSYQGYWALRNPAGDLFGWGPNGDYPFWVDIQVVQPTATPTQPPPTPTETPTTGPTVTPSPIEG